MIGAVLTIRASLALYLDHACVDEKDLFRDVETLENVMIYLEREKMSLKALRVNEGAHLLNERWLESKRSLLFLLEMIGPMYMQFKKAPTDELRSSLATALYALYARSEKMLMLLGVKEDELFG